MISYTNGFPAILLHGWRKAEPNAKGILTMTGSAVFMRHSLTTYNQFSTLVPPYRPVLQASPRGQCPHSSLATLTSRTQYPHHYYISRFLYYNPKSFPWELSITYLLFTLLKQLSSKKKKHCILIFFWRRVWKVCSLTGNC